MQHCSISIANILEFFFCLVAIQGNVVLHQVIEISIKIILPQCHERISYSQNPQTVISDWDVYSFATLQKQWWHRVHLVIQESGHSRLFHSPLAQPYWKAFAVKAVRRDCHWGLKNSGNSHWSCQPIMQWGTRQSWSIFRPTNPKRMMPANWRPWLPTTHKRVMPANWRPWRLPHWQSYCHQNKTV